MKILIVSDSPLRATGFGMQSRDLHQMFTGLGHRVVFLGMHSIVDKNQIQEYNGSVVYATRGPSQPNGRWDGGDKTWLQQACLRERPDIILLVWDLRKMIGIVRDFDRFFRCPTYLYWLFDADPISHQYIDLMTQTRVKILPVSECIMRWLIDADIPFEFGSIPEPVDMTRFYPLGDETRIKLKQKFLGDHWDKFCFGFVGGNFQRKNIPSLIDSFSKLPVEIRDNCVLFMHTDPTAHVANPISAYDLHGIIDAYYPHLKDQIIFSPSNNDIGFDMAKIYNVMDYQVSAAAGEGWGLGTSEGLACGIPMIIGDISTSEEIVGDAGYIVPTSGYLHYPTPYVKTPVVDAECFTKAMEQAYKDTVGRPKFPPSDIRSISNKLTHGITPEQCVEQASKFDIDLVAQRWNDFLEQLDNPHWSEEMVDEPLVIKGTKS